MVVNRLAAGGGFGRKSAWFGAFLLPGLVQLGLATVGRVRSASLSLSEIGTGVAAVSVCIQARATDLTSERLFLILRV